MGEVVTLLLGDTIAGETVAVGFVVAVTFVVTVAEGLVVVLLTVQPANTPNINIVITSNANMRFIFIPPVMLSPLIILNLCRFKQ